MVYMVVPRLCESRLLAPSGRRGHEFMQPRTHLIAQLHHNRILVRVQTDVAYTAVAEAMSGIEMRPAG